ncbi:band 7 protein AGAP004871-like isoform 2-T2 [Glossina fuscipes fuscipes]
MTSMALTGGHAAIVPASTTNHLPHHHIQQQQLQQRGTVGGHVHGLQPTQNAAKKAQLYNQQQQQQQQQQQLQQHQLAVTTTSNSSQRETNSKRPDTTVSISTMYTQAEDDVSDDKASTCGTVLIFLSVVLVILTLPFSLFVCFKVVQEYERAVIFRLGRLMQGGAKGPGIFFILPCIDSYARVDLRTRTYDVPPQELQLDEATDAWGIKVERVEIKDVRLPVQLQRAMAAEAEAAREARAKVIAAEGEQKASRALREASEVIGDSPAALQLRYLQTLSAISAEKNSTIVFPLPIDLITYFLKTNDAQTQKNAKAAAAAMAQQEKHEQQEEQRKQQEQQKRQQQKQPKSATVLYSDVKQPPKTQETSITVATLSEHQQSTAM